MSTKKEEIIGTMTIKEAAANWEDPRRQHLKRWGETFGVPLQELHPGHVVTYQNDRGDETTAAQVDAEVSALLALLKQIGNHCLSTFLAEHLIARRGAHRVGKAGHLDRVALWVAEGIFR